jgi:hypothetical protein
MRRCHHSRNRDGTSSLIAPKQREPSSACFLTHLTCEAKPHFTRRRTKCGATTCLSTGPLLLSEAHQASQAFPITLSIKHCRAFLQTSTAAYGSLKHVAAKSLCPLQPRTSLASTPMAPHKFNAPIVANIAARNMPITSVAHSQYALIMLLHYTAGPR